MKHLLKVLLVIFVYITLVIAFVPMSLMFAMMKASGHTTKSYKHFTIDWFVPSAFR